MIFIDKKIPFTESKVLQAELVKLWYPYISTENSRFIHTALCTKNGKKS